MAGSRTADRVERTCLEPLRLVLLDSLNGAFLLDAVLPGVEEEQRQGAARTDREVGKALPSGLGQSGRGLDLFESGGEEEAGLP